MIWGLVFKDEGRQLSGLKTVPLHRRVLIPERSLQEGGAPTQEVATPGPSPSVDRGWARGVHLPGPKVTVPRQAS